MSNVARFVCIHAVLAIVLTGVAAWWPLEPGGSAVGSAFAIMGKHLFAAAFMPIVAGLITWAIVGRTGHPPPFGFGLRFTALSIAALVIGWLLGALQTYLFHPSIVGTIRTALYGLPLLNILAGSLAARGFRPRRQ